jgi:triphosphatase
MSHEIDLKHDIAPPEGRPWLLRDEVEKRPAGAPVKSEPVPVRRVMTVAEGFCTIVNACVRHFRLNEPLVVETRGAEPLHQARVAIRRLRSALSLFRPVLGDGEFDRIRQELRWFATELGHARNLDVLLHRDLAADQRKALEEKRAAAYDNVIVAMNSNRFQRLMFELLNWSAAGDWRQAAKASRRLEPFVNGRIDRIWTKIAAERRLARMSDEHRHVLRIRVKKLRYALEFVAALHSRERKRQRRFAKRLERLQDELGVLNDAVVARTVDVPGLWGAAQPRSEADERTHLREAKFALRGMRKAGPYWRS